MTLQTPKQPSTLSATEHNRLDHSFIKGIAWTGAAKWSIQVFTWAMTIIIARLLTPDDYGIMAMAGVYIGMLELLTEFGIGSSIIYVSGLSENQIAQVNSLSILFGVAGFVISCGLAVPLGQLFDAPALPGVVAVMGVGFIIRSLQTVPSALLQKEHKFKVLSLIGIVRGIAQSSIVVLFAWLGFRYWSLVVGTLLGSALGAGLTLMVRRHALARPHATSLSHVLKFSWKLLITRFTWYTNSNIDFIIAGRVLGQTALGNYNLAWTLAMTPMEKVTTLISSVTPAFYSAVKEDPSALRRYLLRPIEAISLVLFPTMAGMSLVASDAVPTVLGAKWEASIPALQFLSIHVCMRSITPLFPQVLTAVGEMGFLMWNEIVSLFLLSGALLYGSRWGITGIAAAWVIAYPVNMIPLYWRTHQKIGLSHEEFLCALLPAINGTICMSLVVLAVKWILHGHIVPEDWFSVQGYTYIENFLPMLQGLLDGHFGHGVRLTIQVACGALAYALAIWLFHRKRLLAFRHGFAKIRQ